MVLGTLALIGLGILFYFTAFAHMRMKKQVREINRKFEYLHALLFGQDSQYIKRIEIISRTNILYLDIHMNFNKRFKEIRDSGDSSMQEEVNRIRDYLNEHNYKELKLDLPNVKAKLAEFEEKVNSLNDDLLAVIRPEDFDLVFDDPESAILHGTVVRSAFTGVSFHLWVNCQGQILMVEDYQNAEIGQEVGLKVDFYEIHLMKVEDDAQPLEIRKIREEGRRLAEAIEEESK